MRLACIVYTSLFACALAQAAPDAYDALNRYVPVDGGWRIRVSGHDFTPSAEPPDAMGAAVDNPRLHRRPLYPPADRSMVWSADALSKLERYGFRPLVVAYVEPRFLFDFHSAGGLLGHLRVGLVHGEDSKWLHDWSELDVRYVDGRMEYTLTDSVFPGITVELSAAPLSASAGLVLSINITGGEGCDLVWAYGGASGFFTNYAMTAPEFAYAPEQCAKDRWSREDDGFTLRRGFDDSDAYMKEIFAAARHIPEWTAVVRAGSDWRGRAGFAASEAYSASPQQLLHATDWKQDGAVRNNCVAVEAAHIDSAAFAGHVVVGMGGDVNACIAEPASAMAAALARNDQIAARVVIHTPDPYLDAAMRSMAFATDGTWGDTAILHGAWSWRFAYLGWRGWYGPVCYGWTDRIRKSIENHITLGLVKDGADAGALGSLLEYEPGVFYNMNEVFLDQVRYYYAYTGDLELMRRIFPVLKGILAWEDRRLQPENAHLYENSLNTWISDSHWYIGGQCTQASAYMLGANCFMAELAEDLGEDPAPFRERARHIRAAMQETLWMPEQGVFAEYRDTRGHRMLHTEPELPTIYHAAEFGAADAPQIAQMLLWADHNLRSEATPGGGTLVWSSNWYPNHGRSYTHSTYEMAYAEELNFALTNYLGGRAEEAYAILRGVLCGIFNGPTPGGLSCHAFVDGRQRANDEFSDAISMWGRAVVERLFGIMPNRPEGYVTLCPQFPDEWHKASISTPALACSWRRDEGDVQIEWTSPVETSMHLRLPIKASSVEQVEINGNEAAGRVERANANINWLCLETPKALSGTLHVRYDPVRVDATAPAPPRPEAPRREPWTPPGPEARDLAKWTLVDLGPIYNAPLTEVLQRVVDQAQPPEMPASQVGFGYWRDHLLQYHGSRNQPVSDAAWRAKVNASGVAWTADGIPFKTSKDGSNIAVVTRAGGFPEQVTIPVGAQGQALYLMISGMTFPAQSHVVNLRLALQYVDGECEQRDLVNPWDIGDCWSTWCGRYHDNAANGFENIGGRSGPTGSIEVADLSQPVPLDTEAQLLRIPLREGVELQSLSFEAYANDVIFGIMGASVHN